MNTLDLFFGIIMPAGLVVIMFGMGLQLSLTSFSELAKFPRAAIGGLAAQLVLPPIVALTLAVGLQLSPTIAIGLLLLSLCPGGATSNILTYLARADLPLSVALTAVNSLLIVVTLPALLMAGLAVLSHSGIADVVVPVQLVIERLLLLTMLPIAAGMLCRHYQPALAAQADRYFRVLAVLLLVGILSALLIAQYDFFMTHLAQIGGLALLFMICVLGLAGVLGRALKLPQKQWLTIVIEVGIQNTVIAVFIASTLLEDNAIAVVPTIYGILMTFVIAPIAWYGHRQQNTTV